MSAIIDHQPYLTIPSAASTEQEYRESLDELIAALPVESQLGLMIWIQDHAQGKTQDRLTVVYARAMEIGAKILLSQDQAQ